MGRASYQDRRVLPARMAEHLAGGHLENEVSYTRRNKFTLHPGLTRWLAKELGKEFPDGTGEYNENVDPHWNAAEPKLRSYFKSRGYVEQIFSLSLP